MKGFLILASLMLFACKKEKEVVVYHTLKYEAGYTGNTQTYPPRSSFVSPNGVIDTTASFMSGEYKVQNGFKAHINVYVPPKDTIFGGQHAQFYGKPISIYTGIWIDGALVTHNTQTGSTGSSDYLVK